MFKGHFDSNFTSPQFASHFIAAEKIVFILSHILSNRCHPVNYVEAGVI